MTPSGDVPATPAIAASFSFADIVGGIVTAKASPAIAGIKTKTHVTFIELHMLAGYDAAALSFTPDQLKALAALDAAIGRNRALEVKLLKAGYLLSDVVALTFDATGNPVVFVNL